MGGLFGGSQKSKNQAYDFIKSNYGPSGASAFNGGINQLGNLLGVNGSEANGQALQDYWNSAGGQFQLDQGLGALTNKYASMGLLKSGPAMKAMEQYRQGLASTYLNNYLGQVGELSKLGLGAGSLLADAGQTSSGGGGGMGSFIGALLAGGAAAATGGLSLGAGSGVGMALSDRRLKTNIVKVGEAADGLGIHEWNWKSDPGGKRVRGVIADEVEKLRPWAFVPNFVGEYAGVNYAKLGALQ